MHFINKIITPVLELETEEDLINFLDLSKEPNETTKFFANKKVPLGNDY